MKSEIEVQNGRPLKWLPTAETKNWVWDRSTYSNDAWEAFEEMIDKIILSISADSTADGLLRITVTIMRDSGSVIKPLHVNQYIVEGSYKLPGTIIDNSMDFKVKNLAESLQMNYAWNKFCKYIVELESRGD